MLGLFGTLNLASRSLQTQMAGVATAGQNLANVNTPGYTRQRVVIQTSAAIETGVGPQGTGASLLGIEQIVDKLLNGQIQNQTSVSAYWNTQQSTLQSAQTSLNEFLASSQNAAGASATGSATASSGLSDRLGAFFNSLQALSTSPASIPARQAVIGAAQSLAATFQQIDTRLASLHTGLDTSLNNQVGATNQLLTDIASLNDHIANAQNYGGGGTANDLLDLRQQKLEALAGYLNFQSSTAADGTLTVTSLTNQTLVSGNQVVNALKTVPDPLSGQLQVLTTVGNNVLTGVSFGLTGGSLAATVDARDGALTSLQNSINTLAVNLTIEVNNLHAAGFNLAGGTGAVLFTGGSSAGIAVNQAIAADPSLLQAGGTAGLAGDGSVARSIAQLASTSLAALNNQSFSSSYAQSVAQLGESLRNANDQAATQASVAGMLASQRSSISGVNLDEEMTNLMTFQRAYQASAHLVTTVDQMLQVLLAMKT